MKKKYQNIFSQERFGRKSKKDIWFEKKSKKIWFKKLKKFRLKNFMEKKYVHLVKK